LSRWMRPAQARTVACVGRPGREPGRCAESQVGNFSSYRFERYSPDSNPSRMYDRRAASKKNNRGMDPVHRNPPTVVLGNLILRYDRPGFRGFGMFERAALDVTRPASSADKTSCSASRARTQRPFMGAAQEFRAVRIGSRRRCRYAARRS